VACIILNNDDNRIILDQGANSDTSYIQVSEVLNYLACKNDILLAQLEVPVDTVLKSFSVAKQKGLKTILNPAPAQKLPEEMYCDIDIIIPNEIEAEMITGISSKSENFDQEVINYFLSRGVKEVIITKGCHGSVYGNLRELVYVDPYNVEVVDTTGAGDAFVGAIACEVAKGRTVKNSLKFATASSALAVTKFGAQSSMPHYFEVEEFLKRK
jgi:ribokinase